MPKVEVLIAEARRLLGTPYRPSGAATAGVNCLGLWVLVARNVEGLEGLAKVAAPFAERAREEAANYVSAVRTRYQIAPPPEVQYAA